MEGIGWYTYETIGRIVRQHPEHKFIFLFDRPYNPKFLFANNVRPIAVGPPARHPFLYILWFNWSVKRILRKEKPDIFVSPDGFLSLGSSIPQLPVIHDLNFEHYPKDLPFWYRWYYRRFFPKFARAAKRILTVSEFSKQDIVQQYGIDPNKIDVAWNGVNDIFEPIGDDEKQKVKNEICEGQNYFLYIGATHSRKNVGRLLEAFDRISGPEKLVIAGGAFWWNGKMQSIYKSMARKDDVIFTGRLDPMRLAQILGAAHCLCYLSYFEGFGIPLVEAMRCGTPVLAADATSLPEVCGDAALYVDPFDVAAISDGMKRILEDEELHKELSGKGLERSKVFDWQKTADGMWNSIEKIIDA